MSRIEQEFSHFIKKHLNPRKPVLLGLSGGPDSLALFYLLLKQDVLFHVAHVDHGWRSESKEEAEQLEQLCKRKNIPFYLKRLESIAAKNAEDAAREERYVFFADLIKNFDLQGVILGHHANDQAETILKRIFEESFLASLHAMQPVSQRGTLTLFRPLIDMRKQEIIDWLSEIEITPFIDKSNGDRRFLRGRMRKELIPHLSETFGKEVIGPLCRLGHQARELKEFIQRYAQTYEECLLEGPLGMWFDFSKKFPDTAFELRAVLRHFLEKKGYLLPATLLDQIISHLKEKKMSKFHFSDIEIWIEGHSLFIFLTPNLNSFPKNLVREGTQAIGPWNVSLSLVSSLQEKANSWKTLWKGEAEVRLPRGAYGFGHAPLNSTFFEKCSLAKWYSSHRVPRCLRQRIPCLFDWSSGKIVYEFLTGKRLLPTIDSVFSIQVKLNLSR